MEYPISPFDPLLNMKYTLNKYSKTEDLKVRIYLVTGFPVAVAQRVSDKYWDIRVGATQYVGSGDIEVILEQLMRLLAMTGA